MRRWTIELIAKLLKVKLEPEYLYSHTTYNNVLLVGGPKNGQYKIIRSTKDAYTYKELTENEDFLNHRYDKDDNNMFAFNYRNNKAT